jgi:hypothetical protein
MRQSNKIRKKSVKQTRIRKKTKISETVDNLCFYVYIHTYLSFSVDLNWTVLVFAN